MSFKSLGAVSYSPSIVTMAISAAILEIFSVKNGLTLKSGIADARKNQPTVHYIVNDKNMNELVKSKMK